MTFRAEFEHRDDLLRAAVNEFCERGYEGASINRILEAAAVSKGQLYHHFGSKQGLYLALVEWMIDCKVAWFASHPTETADGFIAILGAQLRASIQFATDHRDVDRMSRALLAERGQPIFAAVVDRYHFDSDSALASLVDHSYDRGEFRDDLSRQFARQAVLTIINNLPHLVDLDQPADLEPRIDELLAFLRGGLLRP